MEKGIEQKYIEEFKMYLLERDSSDGTIANYTGGVNDFFIWIKSEYLHEIIPVNITGFDIREYKNYILHNKNLKPNTVNNKLAALNSFFNFLYEKNQIDKNPAQNIKKIKIHTHQTGATITALEIKRLKREVITSGNPLHKMIVFTLAYTGVRVSELIKLKLTDIIIKENKKDSYLVVSYGKGGRYREIPLNSSIIDIYNEWMEERRKTNIKSNYLIITERSDFACRSGINKVIRKYGLKIGRNDLHPHTFRKYFLRTILEVSDISTAQLLAGHSSIQITSTYTVSNFDLMKSAVDKLE